MKFEARNPKFEANSKKGANISLLIPQGGTATKEEGFTLIELLVVIAIIGILAAIAMPTIGMFKPNPLAAASRQLLDDLSFARHKALADHTTVYVVFMPAVVNLDQNTASWNSTNASDQLGGMNAIIWQRMVKAQFNGYALYERRQIGDQPGRKRAHWLTNWRLLPKGTFIPIQKFGRNIQDPPQEKLTTAFGNNFAAFDFMTFNYGSADTNADDGPFFTDPENVYHAASYTRMPFIAFDYRGSLVQPWEGWRGPDTPDGKGRITNNVADCVIPVGQGLVNVDLTTGKASISESQPNSWTNIPGYNLVVIDGPTGRARVERAQVQ